ncbi:MAG: hypothetical protein MJ215_01910 [Spirochaetia bacterium]|nr:hypothetical protein [Spirochaetia bacterium]
MIWLKFAVTALVVVFFCINLSKYADELAEAKNIGKGFVGFVLLGFITSIPELISTVSSTAYLDNPIMGTANIIGSANANMFILFVSLLTAATLRRDDGQIDVESTTSLSFCFIITAVFILAEFLSGRPIYGKSIFVYIIVAAFILSIVALYKSNDAPDVPDHELQHLGFFFYLKLIFFACGLMVSSFMLSIVVDTISRETELGSAAAGAICLAWATSLPELVVTITSVFRGAVEMGIGNILGSNIFNMFILAVAECCSTSHITVFQRDDGLMIFGVLQIILLGLMLFLITEKKLLRIGKIAVIPVFSIALYFIGISLL